MFFCYCNVYSKIDVPSKLEIHQTSEPDHQKPKDGYDCVGRFRAESEQGRVILGSLFTSKLLMETAEDSQGYLLIASSSRVSRIKRLWQHPEWPINKQIITVYKRPEPEKPSFLDSQNSPVHATYRVDEGISFQRHHYEDSLIIDLPGGDKLFVVPEHLKDPILTLSRRPIHPDGDVMPMVQTSLFSA